MQSRRRFCRTLLGAMVLGVAASTPAALDRWRDMLTDIAALFRHPESARRIGRRLLAERPADSRVLLRHTAELRRALAAADDPDARRSMLRRHAARDYAAGNVVLVDGWVLSRTEAHLCALLALA